MLEFPFPTRVKTDTVINGVLEEARQHLGYRWRAGTNNPFLMTVGYGAAQNWDGAFLDVVFRSAGVYGSKHPAHMNPASALLFYGEFNRLTDKPRRGDVVFLTTPKSTQVGLVTDVSNFATEGTFRTIEAQINSGLPRAATELDGVFERTRTAFDVLEFARPLYASKYTSDVQSVSSTSEVAADPDLPLLKPTNFLPKSPRYRSSTEILQYCLGQHPAVKLRNATRGRFDLYTRRAVAKLQRFYGYLEEDATGMPDDATLLRLQREVPGHYRLQPKD